MRRRRRWSCSHAAQRAVSAAFSGGRSSAASGLGPRPFGPCGVVEDQERVLAGRVYISGREDPHA